MWVQLGNWFSPGQEDSRHVLSRPEGGKYIIINWKYFSFHLIIKFLFFFLSTQSNDRDIRISFVSGNSTTTLTGELVYRTTDDFAYDVAIVRIAESPLAPLCLLGRGDAVQGITNRYCILFQSDNDKPTDLLYPPVSCCASQFTGKRFIFARHCGGRRL